MNICQGQNLLEDEEGCSEKEEKGKMWERQRRNHPCCLETKPFTQGISGRTGTEADQLLQSYIFLISFLPFFLLVFWPLEELIGVWNQSEVGTSNPGSLGVDTNLSNFTSDSCNGSDGQPLNFYKWFSKHFLSKAWGRGQSFKSLLNAEGSTEANSNF